MVTLGTVLGAARGASGEFMAWFGRRDAALAESVSAAARAEASSPSGFVRGAIADFGRFASEEDWVQLMGQLHQADEPAMTCLRSMVEWRLSRTGGTHSEATTEGGHA